MFCVYEFLEPVSVREHYDCSCNAVHTYVCLSVGLPQSAAQNRHFLNRKKFGSKLILFTKVKEVSQRGWLKNKTIAKSSDELWNNNNCSPMIESN